MTHEHFKKTIEDTNRFKKIQKQTLIKLKLDKKMIKDTVTSLINANREILKQNKVEDAVDDYIYMNIKLAQSV